jgi:hypothetical protein
MSAGRHCDCGRPIHRQNRSGRCASCAQRARNSPALVARRAATLRQRLAAEPDLRARYCAQLDMTRSGAANAYRLRRLRAAKQPEWVPVEHRPLFSELRRRGLSHPEIRDAIDGQIAIDARAFARTGRLPGGAAR